MVTHYVQSIEHLTESTYRLRINRLDFQLKAGQCVNLGKPGTGINREYSLYSGERESYLDFLIKEVENGVVSGDLKELRPGDPIQLDGPYGEFVLKNPEARKQPYLFIATGTGIAPFHSFIQTYPSLNYTLLHGIRYFRETYHREDYEKERYICCVSREGKGDFQGRVLDYLRQNPITQPNTLCYLCGNRAMISEAYDILREQGISGDHLVTEVFF